ncbi:MAG: hypothetical protein OQK94_11070 [Gammaproteobacteria bacterium]|nr:hypothetical protein [Gammaproteobacteria bacterium]MCW8840463.1 hypothetical protein [Gammaproteobacteria bacterium]MCW8927714.1 hypothetical protein [Gammaproteobacteria bacterium]MCW8957834.1 hypothetical protein [Gammaproteobacteria bacterium]MCW8973275.1 hypothetical protein [Gammaproteobacteria bacterium]
MNYTALSLSQTPPPSVPLPYFLLTPLFAATAALLLLLEGPQALATRWSPTMLALTHLMTIGVLGTTMLGALQQLVPVLVGVPLPAQRPVAWGLFLLWLAGSVLLISAMAAGWPTLLRFGGGALTLAVAVLTALVLRSVWRSSSRHATVRAMGLAVIGFAIAVTIALYLLLRFAGQLPLAHPLTTLHIGWASLGWLFLLLTGVAYQVVPMFQITPEYPAQLRRWLAPVMVLLLLLWSLQHWWPGFSLLGWSLAAGVALFALQTLRLQTKRRRRLNDVTLDFWRLAMISLLLAVVAWAAGQLFPSSPGLELALGLLFFVGFALSAVNGMLYKIVPFLIWLHLNNRLQQAGSWQGRVPNMKQVIPERPARRQFYLHLAALALLLVALYLPGMVLQAAAVVWLLSSLSLGWNLLQALRLYWRISANLREG